MSIAIHDGQLGVFLDPWVDVAAVMPASWYHLAVAKEAGQVRVYLDGARVFTGPSPMLGRQLSPLAIGASAHGFNQGTPVHTDFFRGDVAQVTVWRGAFGDSQAVAAFQVDSALYLPPPVEPTEPVVVLRADHAAGAGPCPSPGAAGPWADLAGPASNATLIGFDGNAASGWQGVGSPGSPYRLRFDGVNDRLAIEPGGVGELLSSCSMTAELWFRPETEVPAGAWQYLIEWLQGFGTSSGMAVAISDGQVQLHLDRVGWVALGPAQSGEWCHLVVVKAPGQVRVYRNGAPVYAGALPDFGEPNSEIVLGGSTWRGPGIHGDFFAGSIAQVCLRRGTMSDTEAAEAFAADQARYFGVLDAPAAPQRLMLAGARPNPGIGGSLAVAFTLPSGTPASLDLIDIGGRRIAHEDVGALGPGHHVVRLGRGLDLPAGVYLIRLQQAGRVLTAKATLMN
jgi:hypothetical protein